MLFLFDSFVFNPISLLSISIEYISNQTQTLSLSQLISCHSSCRSDSIKSQALRLKRDEIKLNALRNDSNRGRGSDEPSNPKLKRKKKKRNFFADFSLTSQASKFNSDANLFFFCATLSVDRSTWLVNQLVSRWHCTAFAASQLLTTFFALNSPVFSLSLSL